MFNTLRSRVSKFENLEVRDFYMSWSSDLSWPVLTSWYETTRLLVRHSQLSLSLYRWNSSVLYGIGPSINNLIHSLLPKLFVFYWKQIFKLSNVSRLFYILSLIFPKFLEPNRPQTLKMVPDVRETFVQINHEYLNPTFRMDKRQPLTTLWINLLL
jgi:hypothetical protein